MAARLLVRLLVHLRDVLVAQLRGWREGGLAGLRRAWAARPPKRQLAAQGLVAALLLLGLASLDARGRFVHRLPSPRDWAALTALLERDARPGDLVAILPPWLEQARQAVPARLPVLGTSALDTEWLPGVRRVWLVAATAVTTVGAHPPLEGRTAAADAQQVGRLQVTRLDLAAPVLPSAWLAERAGAPTRWRDVDGVARRCLELSPVPGMPARLVVPPLALGRALAGHVSLRPATAAGTARLLVRVGDGAPLAVEVTGRSGWQPFRVDTTGLAGASPPVTLEADAPPGAVLCVEAVVLP